MRFPVVLRYALLCLLTLVGTEALQAQSPPNPFAPPQARLQYAPNRNYDLQHVALDITIDYPRQAFRATVVNTLTPLRPNLTAVTFHCGKNLAIESCEIGGYKAEFSHEGDQLIVKANRPLKADQQVAVAIHYHNSAGKGRNGIMADSGLHFIKSNASEPGRVGFWTQGEPEVNREWLPTWDYPNDFTTTETRTTVPADWFVIGNGTLVSNTLSANRKQRTFHWRMTEPHATYLISLAGGPLDVKTTLWRGVTLYYVVPKGSGKQIEDTFGDTPDMLSFFSDITGVKYPWPKYAQSIMNDFGGGMENVSATTLAEYALTDRREGLFTADGLNSHELAHQWFGDLVTCKDWGHIWLNESFASFFEMLYTEHRRGKAAYDREVEGNTQGYLGESRRYKHPLATNFYPNADSMFDSHTYPKGAVILHTLRRTLGDRDLFRGIQHYLTKFRHQPVETRNLCDAISEATGINVEPFFDQWIFKPGHPVLDYTWTWDAAKQEVVLAVKQTQDTRDGTPIYKIETRAGLITGGKLTRVPVLLDQASQEIRIKASGKPDCVLLDPDHDFLREIPTLHWSAEELLEILRFAPHAADRTEALHRMLAGTPSDTAVNAAVEALRADNGPFPVFASLDRLGELKRADLRPFFRQQLTHHDFERRAQAIGALGQLPKEDTDTTTLRGLVNETAPYTVIEAAIRTLNAWDAKGNQDILKRALQMPSNRERIRIAAITTLAQSKSEEGITLLLQSAGAEKPRSLREAALRSMGKLGDEPRTRETLRSLLTSTDTGLAFASAQAVIERKDKELLPVVRKLQTDPPADAPWMKEALSEMLKRMDEENKAKP